jgi:AraC-like DNA-binding protein
VATEKSEAACVLPRSVRRALDLMQTAALRDIGVAELAAAAGLSSRALQRQFRTFLGKTPLEVLHDFRFENARRQLLHGAPGMKVMDVAVRCGFPHVGRFSIEYQRRYGETPSRTLRRQAVFFNTVSSRVLAPVGSERPVVSIGPVESEPCRSEAAREIEAELSTALTRAGVPVSGRSGSARYRFGRHDSGGGGPGTFDRSAGRWRNRPALVGTPHRNTLRRRLSRRAAGNPDCGGAASGPAFGRNRPCAG